MLARRLLLLLLPLVFVCGQITTAVIVGTVTDSSGASVPNAKVLARAVATNQNREVTTGSDGEYILTNLPIGEYEVTASASGFRTEVNKGVVLQVAQRARLDMSLQAGSV